jgi:hypothetical protein
VVFYDPVHAHLRRFASCTSDDVLGKPSIG